MPRPAPTRSLLRAVALVVALVVALAACTGAEEEAEPATGPAAAGGAAAGSTATRSPAEPARAAVAVPELAWESCGGGVECAAMAVPLDWDDPDGPTIELPVARRPADDPGARIGILALNPGGPGGSGVGLLQGSGDLDGLGERFDLVSWDPRGVGGVDAVSCQARPFLELDPGPDDEAERQALDVAAEALADECADDAGSLVRHIGTDQTIRDLDLLREAMGEEQLSYLGFSYGTYLGQRYVDVFPERVRAMVLDGVVDPTQDLEGLLSGQALALDAYLADLFTACELSDACSLEDPAATWDRVAAAVEADPLPAGRGEEAGPAELQTAAIASSYDGVLGRRLLDALADADAGDGEALASLAQLYWQLGDYGPYLLTMCADVAHPTDPEGWAAMTARLAEQAPFTGAAAGNELLPCAWLDSPPPPEPAAISAAGSPPILVIGNTGDVATPAANAERVAAALERGVVLLHDGTGHTSFGSSACVDEIVVAYLVELELPGRGARC